MKTTLILAALMGSSSAFAMSSVDVDLSYTLPGYAAGSAAALIAKLNSVASAAGALKSADLYGGCMIVVNEIDQVHTDAKVFGTLHCDGVDSLDQTAVEALITGSLSRDTGLQIQPVTSKPNPGVVMSNDRTAGGMAIVDVDFAYTLTAAAQGSAAALIADLKKVEMAGAHLKNAEVYGGCLVSTREIDAMGADAKVYATIHCDGTDNLTQEAVAALVSGDLSKAVGIPLQPVTLQHNN